MFDQLKRESLRQLRAAEDKSPKGSIDAPIVDLIQLINDHPDYVTSSSCSGRIAVFCGMPANASAPASADGPAVESHLTTKGGKWLVAEHATVTFEQLLSALQSPDALAMTNSNMLIFKHEPFIMHVVCRNADAAKALLQWGISCGFRESGIVLGNRKIMCAIRTTANSMEIPLARNAQDLLVSHEYLRWIVDIANEKFHANELKTDRLFKAFKATFCEPLVAGVRSVATPSITTVELVEAKELELSEPLKRVGHSSVQYDNKIVVFGGQGPTSTGTTTRLGDAIVYSVATDGSLQVSDRVPESKSAPSARMQHSAVVVDKRMIVFGGRAGPTKPYNDLSALDLESKTWELLQTTGDNRPSPRYKHASCVVGSTMYVYGGRDTTTVFGDLWALDLAQTELAWTRIESASEIPRFDHVAAVVEGSKLLFWGGMTSSSAMGSEVKSYDDKDSVCLAFDTLTMQWKHREIANAAGGPPSGLIASSAASVSSHHVVVVGGMTPATLVNGDNATQQIFMLNTHSMQWKHLGDVSHPKAGFAYHTSTWMQQNQSLYVMGGGFQCFGFGQFYSAPFQCKLVLKQSVGGASNNNSSSKSISNTTPASTTQQSTSNGVGPFGVLATKLQVKAVKTQLERAKVYDKTRRVHVAAQLEITGDASGDSVFVIPVTDGIHGAVAANAELAALQIVKDEDSYTNKFGKTSGLNRNEVIRTHLQSFATKHRLSAEIHATIPDKFEFVGDILLVPRDSFQQPEWQPFAQEMWAKVCSSTTPVLSRVARKAFIDSSEKRQSHVELLYVNAQAIANSRANAGPGWVEIRENGIVYGWDITRVMFSSGNVTEKARMGRIGCKDETIVDLFCGIGYYVLPFLVHGGAKFVHACEWNPDSVDALRFNLERNHVADRCQVYLGDNQVSAPTLGAIADRVNLGLLPTAEKAWPLAVQVMKPTGGWMHVHENVAVEDREAWEQRLVDTMQSLAKAAGRNWSITCTHVERVKSYAPKVYHYVADLHCVPSLLE